MIASFSLTSMAQSATGAASSPASATSSASKAAGERVVMKVGDQQITQAQFEQMIADLEAQQGPADLSRKKLGDNFASLFILSQQAVADHLESSPEVVRQMAIDRTQILSNAEFAKLKTEAKPTSAQISEYYNTHLQDYDVVTLRRVFIWKTAPGQGKELSSNDVAVLSEKIRQAYAAGSDPKKALNNPSNVQFDAAPISFQRGEMPAEMEKVAFAIAKDGDWGQLAEDPGTTVMIQLVSRSRRSLSDMTPQIEKKLQNETLRKELESLKKKTGVWMDETYFASKSPGPGSSAEPGAPGNGKTNSERGEERDER